MEPNNFRAALVGCGNIALTQVRYIRKNVDNERIALCDRNRLRLDWLAGESGVGNVFNDLDEMLENFRPDVVHILTPPRSHKDIAIKCIRAGCHVFIEKPMCLDAKEAEEILSESRKAGVTVAVDHMRLYDPLTLKAQELIRSGRFGNVVNISITETDNYIERKKIGITPGWMASLPGEIIFDLLPHHLSILIGFIPEVRLVGVSHQKRPDGVLENLQAIFSSPTGVGSIRLSLNGYPIQNSVVMECTEGTITLDFHNRLILTRARTGLPSAAERLLGNMSVGKQLIIGTLKNAVDFARGKLDVYAGMDNAVERFYCAITGKGAPPVGAEDGLRVITLIEEIFASVPGKQRIGEAEPSPKPADVLVTGGTGFIGRRLVKRLIARGLKVRVLTHRDIKDESESGGPELVKGDISNGQDVIKAVKGVRGVYHLAAAMRGRWLAHLDATVTGTMNVVEACEREGVESLTYVSTIGLFNSTKYPRNGIVDEDFPYEEYPERRGNYAHAKFLAEKIVMEAMGRKGMKINIIRPGLVYGGGKDLLGDIAKRVGRKLLIIIGSGRKRVPLVYVDNLVDALEIVGESGRGGVFNLVDEEEVRIRDIVKAYRRYTGERLFVYYIPIPVLTAFFWVFERAVSAVVGKPVWAVYKLKTQSRGPRFSMERARRELGWDSRLKFAEGINETIRNKAAR